MAEIKIVKISELKENPKNPRFIKDDKFKKLCQKRIYHFNRIVIHPDYQGLGLGIKFINETSKILKEKIPCKIMGKFSSIPVYKSMKKQSQWKFLKTERLMGKMKTGGNMDRKSGFREQGIKTFHFEYIG